MLIRFVALILVLLASGCAGHRTTYSGTVHTEAIDVGSKIGGRVDSVLVAAGNAVRAGQVLVRLDDQSERADLAQAQARLAQARAQLADLLAGSRPAEIARAAALTRQAEANSNKVARAQPPEIAAARAQLRDARAAVVQAAAAAQYAKKTYARDAKLGASGDVARAVVDQARSNRDQAQAALASAYDRANRAAAQLAEVERAQAAFDPKAAAEAARAAAATERLTREGSRPQQIAQARATVTAAAAAVSAARDALGETAIATPVAGVIEAIDLNPGDLLAPRAAAATVDTLRDPYVRIYVPQQYLSAFAVGRTYAVRSDALPNEMFEGVDEAHDRVAQFTPRDVQTAEDRAELTFGIKIRIHDPNHRLYGGTTVTVSPP